MKKYTLIPIVALLFLQGCATTFVGKAEQTTQSAADIFNAFVTAERQVNPLPVSEAAKKTPLHQYAQYIRNNSGNWLTSARALTETYRLNPTAENESSVKQILATITTALEQSKVYLAQLGK